MWDYYRHWIRNTDLYHSKRRRCPCLCKRQEKSGQQGLENTREFAYHLRSLRTFRSNRGNAYHAPQDPETQVLSGLSLRGCAHSAYRKVCARHLLTGIQIIFWKQIILKKITFAVNHCFIPNRITDDSNNDGITNRIPEISKNHETSAREGIRTLEYLRK